MSGLVEMKKNEAFTTSKVIAEGTNNEHHAIKQLIRKFKAEIEEFGTLRILNAESSGGRPSEYYLLNEEQATFVMTLLRNSKVVVQFKKELVRQFYAMRQFIMERQSEEWKTARLSGKSTRLQETDVIKQLIEYAEEQGSTHADMLYVTYTKLVKKIMPGNRDGMSATELYTMSVIENIVLQTIRTDMAVGKHYKTIYQDCKHRLEQFKDIVYLDTIRSLAGEAQKSIA